MTPEEPVGPVTLGEVYRLTLATHHEVELLREDLVRRSHKLTEELQKMVSVISVMGEKHNQLETVVAGCPDVHRSMVDAQIATHQAVVAGQFALLNQRVDNVHKSAGLIASVVAGTGAALLWFATWAEKLFKKP